MMCCSLMWDWIMKAHWLLKFDLWFWMVIHGYSYFTRKSMHVWLASFSLDSKENNEKLSRRVPHSNEPTHEIMALITLLKLNLQTRMRSNPLALHVWFLVRPFVYFHTACVRRAKAMARLRAWPFAVRLRDKYHNLMSQLKYRSPPPSPRGRER